MRTPWLAACAVLGAALLLRCSGSHDPAPEVKRTASGVEGFELRHTGFGNARLFPGNFSLGYAIQAAYPYVLYRGEVYRRAGPGSVFVRPAAGLKPRYLVEETPAEPLKRYGDTRSELVVSDSTTGEVMARRHLRMGRSEDGHGWAGQHAVKFLHQVLHTAAPGAGRRATAAFEALEEGVAAPEERTGVGCPASYRVDKERTSMALDTGAWIFVPPSHLNSFACQGGLILVESGHGFTLSLDLLSAGGEHLFQTELQGKLALYAKNALRRLRFEDGEMQVDFVHAPFGDRGATVAPPRLLRVRIALPAGIARAASSEQAVK